MSHTFATEFVPGHEDCKKYQLTTENTLNEKKTNTLPKINMYFSLKKFFTYETSAQKFYDRTKYSGEFNTHDICIINSFPVREMLAKYTKIRCSEIFRGKIMEKPQNYEKSSKFKRFLKAYSKIFNSSKMLRITEVTSILYYKNHSLAYEQSYH